jgi:hypothetical protein
MDTKLSIRGTFILRKFDSDFKAKMWAKTGDKCYAPFATERFENGALNVGITELWNIYIGSGGSHPVYNNANSGLAVGNGTTAFNATQTGLQGSSTYTQVCDAGYPTGPASGSVTYQITVPTANANFSWQECALYNASSNIYFDRAVNNMGTKNSTQTWTLQLVLTLS